MLTQSNRGKFCVYRDCNILDANILTFATLNVATRIFHTRTRYLIITYNPVPIYYLTHTAYPKSNLDHLIP